MTDEVAQLKQAHHATWAAGDYARIAEMVDAVPPDHVVERAGVEPGMEVLDVATGSGNVALRAAARGARVTGLDLTPELFEAARRRAAEWGVEVEWVAGDAEDLPFEDGRFDRVLSVFGVMFAPRHEVAARELVRVTKPGGTIGVISWTPEGSTGALFKTMAGYTPPPPPFAQPPLLWGNEGHLRELFADAGVELEFERGMNPFEFESEDAYATHLETYFGPMVMARQALGERWAECRADVVSLFKEWNSATDGSVKIDAEYLLMLGRKPG